MVETSKCTSIKNFWIPESLGAPPKPHGDDVVIFTWIFMLVSIAACATIVGTSPNSSIETKIMYDGNLYLKGRCDGIESFSSGVMTINSTTFQILDSMDTLSLRVNSSIVMQFDFRFYKPASHSNGTSYYEIRSNGDNINVIGNKTFSKTFLAMRINVFRDSFNISVGPTTKTRCDAEVYRSVIDILMSFSSLMMYPFVIMPVIASNLFGKSIEKTQRLDVEEKIRKSTAEQVLNEVRPKNEAKGFEIIHQGFPHERQVIGHSQPTFDATHSYH